MKVKSTLIFYDISFQDLYNRYDFCTAVYTHIFPYHIWNLFLHIHHEHSIVSEYIFEFFFHIVITLGIHCLFGMFLVYNVQKNLFA